MPGVSSPPIAQSLLYAEQYHEIIWEKAELYSFFGNIKYPSIISSLIGVNEKNSETDFEIILCIEKYKQHRYILTI